VVRRIEPAGFTKLSSLGVEQKRVRVIVRPLAGPPLGAGYRLEAEFLIASKRGVLGVERQSLLQRPDGTFYVFVVRDGKLREQAVRVGVTEDLRVEVVGGLSEGDLVVTAPDSAHKEGAEVSPVPI
jgi:HlyD family secretion protein